MKGRASRDKAVLSKDKRRHKGRRVWLALGLIALVVVGAMGYRFWQRSWAQKTILVLADLETGAQRGSVTEAMVHSLRGALAPYRDVRIVTLGRALNEAEGRAMARAEGMQRRAAIVVWGARDADRAALGRLYLELLKLPRGVPEPMLTQSLVVQVRFSERMTIPALLAAGVARYVAEDWDGALAICGSVLALSSEQPTDSVLSLVYVLLADAHYAKGDLTQAIAAYGEALAIKPDMAEALVKRGIAYGAQGDYDRAIRDFGQAIALRRDLAEAYYYGGNAYYAKRELEMAIAYYDQAIAKRPDYAEAYCDRGLAYASDGDYERALRDLDQAVRLKPDFVRAYSNRGSVHYAQGDYARAIADYDRVIALKPDFAEAYFNRGVTYIAQGEKERAIKDLERFLELSTDPGWRQVARQKLEELGTR